MQTVLDDAKMWFLHAIVYHDELSVIVVEGFKGDTPEDLHVGKYVIEDAHLIDASDQSRFFEIKFSQFIAWQVVDETYTSFDEYEQGDKGVLRVLDRSRYLDYVNASHGWYADFAGPGKHYRVWTGDEVIDVVACAPPTIEPWTPPESSAVK